MAGERQRCESENGDEIRYFQEWNACACAFSPDGKRSLSGSRRDLKLWDAATGDEFLTLTGHAACYRACAFSPDGKRLLSGSVDQNPILWDPASGQRIFTLKGHGSGVTGCSFTPDGQRIISSSLDASVKVWSATTGEMMSLKTKE